MNWKLYFAGLGFVLLVMIAGYANLFYSYGTLAHALEFYSQDVNSLEQFCDYRENLSAQARAAEAFRRLHDGNLTIYKDFNLSN